MYLKLLKVTGSYSRSVRYFNVVIFYLVQVLVWPASRIQEMLSSSPTPFRLCPTASLNALPAFTSTEFLQPIANTPEFGVPFWVLVAPFARPINSLPSITASGNA